MRNSSATMMAAFMFGMVTFHRRCHQVAPSTWAASWRTSGTWARPASSSSEMNGVVFQISARQITSSDVHLSPNQSVSALMPGSQANQLLTKPVLMSNANCQANADTTVMTAYGIRIAARRTGRSGLQRLRHHHGQPEAQDELDHDGDHGDEHRHAASPATTARR